MYDYRGKIAGGVIAVAAAIATLVQKLTHITVFKKLDQEQHYFLGILFVVVGLYTMAFSREKNDDERVKQVRARSLQIAFMFYSGIMIALAFNGIIFRDLVFDGSSLLFVSAFGIAFYLIIFHIGIYFDSVWDYGEEPGILNNIKKNKWYVLLTIIGGITLISLIALLFNAS